MSVSESIMPVIVEFAHPCLNELHFINFPFIYQANNMLMELKRLCDAPGLPTNTCRSLKRSYYWMKQQHGRVFIAGMFMLNKNTVIMLSNVILTYCFILYQYKPEESSLGDMLKSLEGSTFNPISEAI